MMADGIWEVMKLWLIVCIIGLCLITGLALTVESGVKSACKGQSSCFTSKAEFNGKGYLDLKNGINEYINN